MQGHRIVSSVVLCLAAGLVACGGASPPPSSPVQAEREPAEVGADERAQAGDWGSTEAEGEEACYDKCKTLIERADALYAQAEKRGEDAKAKAFVRAGDAYVLAWRGCSLSVPHGDDLGCPGGREVVPQMVQSFERGGDDAKHVHALLVANDFRWRPQDDARVEPSALQSVAKRIEQQVANNQKDPGSLDAIEAAAYARIAAGDEAEAARDRALFNRLAGKDRPEARLKLAVALAAAYNDAGSHQRALTTLGRPPSDLPARISVLWHSERGRALAGLKRQAQAKQAFARALDAWGTVSKGGTAELGGAQPWPMQGRERVVEAVGAAYFYEGELLRARAEAMKFPRYQGPKSVQGVTAFVNEKVAPYVRDRQKAMLEAEQAYRKVSEVEPVPPPRYVVASAAAMGQMYASLARDVIESPLPPHLADDEDVAQGYRKTLEESMKPLMQKARRAFTLCRDRSRELRLEGEFVDTCERWLREHPSP